MIVDVQIDAFAEVARNIGIPGQVGQRGKGSLFRKGYFFLWAKHKQQGDADHQSKYQYDF